jgi:hypothetical protein
LQRLGLVTAMAGLSAGVATAQPPTPPRSFGELFYPAAADQTLPRSLTLTNLVYQGYDSQPVAEDSLPAGSFTAADANLLFTKRSNRYSFLAQAGGAVRLYSSLGAATSLSHNGALAFTLNGRRATFDVRQTVNYLPFYALAVFPGSSQGVVDLEGSPEYALRGRPLYTHLTTAYLTQRLTRKSALLFSYRLRYNDFLERRGPAGQDPPELNDLTAQSLGIRFQRDITRSIGLHAGYVYRRVEYPAEVRPEPLEVDDLDIGVSVKRRLSLSRRTSLTFDTGSSILRDAAGRNLIVNGSVTLERQFGRTWQGAIFYQRGLVYNEGFAEPILADGLSVSLGGSIRPRADFLVSGGYSVGALGLHPGATEYRTYRASTRLRLALTRRLAGYGEYIYYSYEPSGPASSTRFSVLNRQALRIGVLLVLPIIP